MGLFSGVGGFINDVLGGTTSAQKAQKYQLAQMAQQDKYNEKYAKNAHQWEVQDLMNAGLNPVLSAGGSSAGAIAGSSVSSGSGISSTNGNIGDLINAGTGIATTMSQLDLNKSISAKNEAETAHTLAQLDYLPKEIKAKLNNLAADTLLKQEQTKTESAKSIIKKGVLGFFDDDKPGSHKDWKIDLGV